MYVHTRIHTTPTNCKLDIRQFFHPVVNKLHTPFTLYKRHFVLASLPLSPRLPQNTHVTYWQVTSFPSSIPQTHTHTHTHTHTLTRTNTHTHAHIRTHKHTLTHTHTPSYTHTFTRICTHAHSHTRTHSHTDGEGGASHQHGQHGQDHLGPSLRDAASQPEEPERCGDQGRGEVTPQCEGHGELRDIPSDHLTQLQWPLRGGVWGWGVHHLHSHGAEEQVLRERPGVCLGCRSFRVSPWGGRGRWPGDESPLPPPAKCQIP